MRFWPGLLVFLALFSGVLRAEEEWFDPAYYQAQTTFFGTGYIAVPSAEVLDNNMLCGGIHRFRLKVNYGLWDIFEFGMGTDLDQDNTIDNIFSNIHFQAKARLLSQERQGISLAVGAEGLGLEALGWGSGMHFVSFGYALPGLPGYGLSVIPTFYAVAGRTLPYFSSFMVSGGIGSGRFNGSFFGNVSKVLFPGFLIMTEYDGQGTNLGARMLLSSEIKLDLGVYHTQDIDPNQYFGRVLQRNIFFGVSYTEGVQWGWF